MRYYVLIIVLISQSLLWAINKGPYHQWLLKEEKLLLETLASAYKIKNFKCQCILLAKIYKPSLRPHCSAANPSLSNHSKIIAQAIGLDPSLFTVYYDPKLSCIAEAEGPVVYVNSAIDNRPYDVTSYLIAHELYHIVHYDSFALSILNITIPQSTTINDISNRYKRFIEIRADICSCLLRQSYTTGMIDSLNIIISMNTGVSKWCDHPCLLVRKSLAEFMLQDHTQAYSKEQVSAFLEKLSALY